MGAIAPTFPQIELTRLIKKTGVKSFAGFWLLRLFPNL